MRSKILSTQRVRFYKLINLTIWLVLLALIIIHLIRGADFFLFYWGLGFYKLYFQRVRLLRNIEYDQASLYIVDKGQEIEISDWAKMYSSNLRFGTPLILEGWTNRCMNLKNGLILLKDNNTSLCLKAYQASQFKF